MFEKSKSAITFEEFQKKLNEVNNFESEWGHFYDPDNNNDNNIFQPNLYYQKKFNPNLKPNKEKKIDKIDKIDKIEEPFVDIEKSIKKSEKNEIVKKLEDEDNKKIIVIEIVFDYIKKIFITFTMVYFIFKVI
jgi:hypothetical protein